MESKQPVNTPNSVNQSVSEEKQQNIPPMAMAEIEIMKLENAKSAADKSPGIRNIALLLLAVLGVNVLSQVISYLLVTSFDDTQTFLSIFISSNGILGMALLLIQAIAIFILLFTRDTSRAKTIILGAGIIFGISLISSIARFDIGPGIMTNIATVVVYFLIFRKIFKVYLEL